MRITFINSLDDSGWDDFISHHIFGSVYHHSAWQKVITNTFPNTTPLCTVLEDSERQVKSAILFFLIRSRLTGTRLVSLPFSPFCDPLVDSLEDFTKLLEVILREARKLDASYLEMRVLNCFNLLKVESFEENFLYFWKTYRLPLKNGTGLFEEKFHKTAVQQRIKKAEKNLKLIVGTTEQNMKEFYSLYVSLSAKKHGIIPKPFRFFRNILKYMQPNNLMTLLLAEYDGEIIGGIVLLKFKHLVHSEYLASDPRFLKYHPNHFLIWEAIKLACREGFQYFDFGRAARSQEGLIEFKKNWAGDEYEVPYLYFPKMTQITCLQEDSKKIRFSSKIIPKLPLQLTKLIARIVYNHMGGEPNIIFR